ncbi:hypothetical protein MUB24_12670 [Lederbergia sp. NSJ-179]|uniref:hypothetical protein n=1 Tax=Lederbergia sp. NSJ-179 TaxID=2931402 RepID=UPI001FD43F3C|nr:hypothetical protein [Lederbergia sp. NSJ-179]MCJ7841735.1 hypothetical protein [Lederbergia sp. NSJ-179]
MKALIHLQFRSVFTKQTCLVTLLFFILFAFLQGFRLRQYFLVYELAGNVLDFLLFTVGGWQNPTVFMFILSWILLMFVFLYFSLLSATCVDQLFNYVLTRLQKRGNVWIANCVMQCILSVLFFLLFALLHLLIGWMLFENNWSFSEYSLEFYPEWVNPSLSIQTILYRISLIFISGLYALFMMFQMILLLPFNKTYMYLSFVLLLMGTSVAYVYARIPRIFVPFFYSSTISLQADQAAFISAFISNIFILIFCGLMGYFLWRKREIRN